MFSLKVIRAYDALHSPSAELQKARATNATAQLRTKLLDTIEGDQIKQEVVPYGYVVVDPKSAISLRTVIMECVPLDLLTIVFCAANSRMVEGMEKIQKAGAR